MRIFVINENGEIIEFEEKKIKKFSFLNFINNFIKKELYYILFALIFTFFINIVILNYKLNEIIKIGYFSYNKKVYKILEIEQEK